MKPGIKEAKDAARRAALQASAVYKAVMLGPQAPAPAALGVELSEFQKALPWFRWAELTALANHFGRRGTVKEDIAVEVARAIRSRMVSAPSSPQEDASPSTARALALRSAQSPKEVTAVAYSFSKLLPQLPEYAGVYEGVAHGVQHGAWTFSRLQAALLGTALADVNAHLADALPTLLWPVIRELVEEPALCEGVSCDELRYLLHASVKLPKPGLTAEAISALSACTKRLAPSATFSEAAHLLAGWLHVCPPADAKKVHQEAMHAVCAQVYKLSPSAPAHPLPAEGLASAVAALLARERERQPPPLTPPKFRDIIHSLVQITRGLKHRPPPAEQRGSLSLADWAELAWHVVEFCEVHCAADTLGPTELVALPGWAADTLGFVFSRAHLSTGGVEPAADLDTVLSLLRLLRRHKPHPAPGPRFFSWAAGRVVEHYDAGNANAAALAEALGDLIPHLPEEERAELVRMSLAGARARGGTSPVGAALLGKVQSPEQWPPSRRLLAAGGQTPRAAAGVALVEAPPASATAPTAATASGQSLWGLLARDLSQEAPTRHTRARRVSEAAVSRTNQEVTASVGPALGAFDASVASIGVAGVEAAEGTHEPQDRLSGGRASDPLVVTGAADAGAGVAESIHGLQERLKGALQRVEALEARLESRLQEREEQLAAESRSRVEAMCGTEVEHEPKIGSWDPHSLFPDSVAGTGMPGATGGGGGHGTGCCAQSMTTAAPYLQRFSFEEYRRMHSRQLQAERVRVLVPPDHLPMWPLRK